MPNLTIRPPAAPDYEQWKALWTDYQAHFRSTVPPDVTDRSWRTIVEGCNDLQGRIAEDDGRIAGFVHFSFTPFVWTASPICFLQDLYVAEHVRGSGIGHALVKAVYEAADARQAANIFWLADMRDERLLALYRRIALETPFVRFLRHPWAW